MIRLLKRWFATKQEADALWSHHDHVASYVQELRRSNEDLRKQVEELTDAVTAPKKASIHDWRPTKPSNEITLRFNKAEQIINPRLQRIIDNKMIQLAGSKEGFIRKNKQRRCTVLISSAIDRKRDNVQRGQIERVYSMGELIMRNLDIHTGNGNPMRRTYLFKSEMERQEVTAYIESLKTNYTTGRSK